MTDADDDKVRRRRALARAYALRSFEIEHYWKRATYFWGFQIAIFAAVGLVWKDRSDLKSLFALSLAAMGVLTAFAGFLSADGSRFWQRNWESHIDMLEEEFEGRLHKTVWLRDGKASYSVSRLNQVLSFCLFMFWLIIGFVVAARCVGWDLRALLPQGFYVTCIAVLTFVGCVVLASQVTNLKGKPLDDKGEEIEPCRSRLPLSRRLIPKSVSVFLRRGP